MEALRFARFAQFCRFLHTTTPAKQNQTLLFNGRSSPPSVNSVSFSEKKPVWPPPGLILMFKFSSAQSLKSQIKNRRSKIAKAHLYMVYEHALLVAVRRA
jgi:hypothetical protein